MNVSVILCTYNRCGSLASALKSVAASQFRSPTEWEVLTVDNNSSDQTRAVAEEFCKNHPGRFRYIFEGQQGKSNALNRGIRESKGNILAFMDDDVVADPDWLENVTAPLKDSKWMGVGGRIVPPLRFFTADLARAGWAVQHGGGSLLCSTKDLRVRNCARRPLEQTWHSQRDI